MTIDLARAFSFVSDDPRWLPKLLLTAIYSAVASFLLAGPALALLFAVLPPDTIAQIAEFSPMVNSLRLSNVGLYYSLIPFFLVGLMLLAVLLGYYVELVRRTRQGVEHPLPEWVGYGRMFKEGGVMVLAYAGYLVSNLALFGVGVLIVWFIGRTDAVNAPIIQLVVLSCCVVPLIVLYGLVIIFLTSICVVPYSETARFRDFYRWGWVWQRIREDGSLTNNWFWMGVLANFGFSAVQSIPVVGLLGLLLTLSMQIPVQGHLLGQYAAALDARHAESDSR